MNVCINDEQPHTPHIANTSISFLGLSIYINKSVYGLDRLIAACLALGNLLNPP